ncbi:MFS transporter [Actinocorallia populi]|uniref:MFS transporter n=1 Tax=Actinocorallia populi TaxID=2079200 RepID=UPI001E528271|nr:MFS transporter [Actinocorallia populi]
MGIREVWRERDFRRLYATRLTSQFADGMVQIALGGYIFFSPEQQTTAAKAAVAFAVLLLPYSVLGPFTGVLLDRWRRRQVLVYTPLVRAACVLVMTGLMLLDTDAFLLAALVVLGVNRFFLAALPAALPHVVPGRELLLANTVSVTSGTIASFVGAGVGFVVQLAGAQAALLAAACCYLATSVVARTLPPDGLGPDELHRETVRNVVVGMVAGLRHVAERRPAALALGTITLYRFLYGLWLIMTLLLYRNHFPSGFGGVAVITAVSGVGFFVGAVITPPVTRRIGRALGNVRPPEARRQAGMDLWIPILLGTAAAGLLFLAVPFREPLYVAGGFVLGVAAQGVKVCVDTIVQQSVDDEFRGRVFAAYDMLFNAAFVGAACVAAAVLPQNGLSYAVLGFTIVAYVLGALGYYTLASRWRVTSPAA